MADLHDLSKARTEMLEIRRQVEAGEICEYCLLADCPRDSQNRVIYMGNRRGYPVTCCLNKAKELQEAEDLRQKGIRGDVVAGLMRLSGIPERFRDASLATFRADLLNGEALAAAVQLVNEFKKREETGRGLILVGPVGTGKSHLCVGIIRALISQGIPSRYIYVPDLLGLLRDRSPEASLLEITQRELATERCLVLDDLGVDKDSAWVEATLARLIDGRHRNHRVTVFATNLGLEDLEKTVGERSMSRLMESNVVVQVAGEDRRLM